MGAVTREGYYKIALGLVACPVVGCIVWLSLNVRNLGWRFEYLQPALELDYVMGIFMWAVFAVGILIVGGNWRRMLLLGWIGKLFVLLVAMLFYEEHYEADAIAYFSFRLTGEHYNYDASGLSSFDLIADLISGIMVPFEMDVYNDGGMPNFRNKPMENFLALFALVTSVMPPYFHALKVGVAFIGFMGSWCFYRAVVVALGREYPAAFYLLAFFPSIIFWSSVLGKDPLIFLFLGLYAYGGALWLVQGRLTALGIVGVGLLGATLIRPWMGIVGAVSLVVANMLGRCRPRQVAAIVLASALVLPFYWEEASSRFRDLVIMEVIQQRVEGVAGDTAKSSGSGAQLPDLQGEEPSTLLPLIVFSGLFRPLPFDITNPFTALAAVENSVVLLLAVAAIHRFRLAYLRDPLVLWPILFSLMWAALYGLVVMANFGSGVRYKLQTMPFLLLVVMLLTHREGRALLASRISGKKKER